MSPDERQNLSRAIESGVAGMSEYKRSRVVLAYAATEEEVRTAELIDCALAEGKTVVLPRVEGEELVLHSILGRRELSPGRFGILEPPASCPTVAPERVDLALIPGVAFDQAGWRLGMGKGFYDRLLPKLEKAFTVGLAYESQIVDEVERGGHDRPVDAVVTEKRVIRRGEIAKFKM